MSYTIVLQREVFSRARPIDPRQISAIGQHLTDIISTTIFVNISKRDSGNGRVVASIGAHTELPWKLCEIISKFCVQKWFRMALHMLHCYPCT